MGIRAGVRFIQDAPVRIVLPTVAAAHVVITVTVRATKSFTAVVLAMLWMMHILVTITGPTPRLRTM